MRTVVLFSFLFTAHSSLSAKTEVIFDPSSPDAGPFPSDVLTVPDAKQKTGKRIDLPVPAACRSTNDLSVCTDTLLLNQLDGFSLNPRIRVCFSDSINPSTIRDGVFLLGIDHPGIIRINQIFYDPAAKCAFAKPDSVLKPSSRYVLVVTESIRDTRGKAVESSKAFKDWLKNSVGAESKQLAAAIGRLPVSAASLFTTLSATDWLEKARAFVNAEATPSVMQPLGPVDGFPLGSLTSFKWLAQTNINGGFTSFDIPTQIPGVAGIAFGTFLSPNFIATSGPLAGSIPATPTRESISRPESPEIPGLPRGFVPVPFHIFIPETPKPAGGYPVAIYGHGLTDNRFGAATTVASTLASQGIATLAVELLGHGFGPGSLVELGAGGQTITLPAFGRGVPLSQNGEIGPLDGCFLPGPLATRDCVRQSAVDMFALVRAISDSKGYYGHLNPNRIFYLGQSFGSVFGTAVNALEPRFRAAALNVGGGTVVDVARFQQPRLAASLYLAGRKPPLLNLPYGFPHPLNTHFEDNYVFRNQPPVVNNLAGVPEIQAAFEVAEWLNMPGEPLAYASKLTRPVLFQFAKGDQEVPNPANSALIRTAGKRSSSRWLLFSRAREAAGDALPSNPHRFLASPEIYLSPARLSIAIAAQSQIAGFFQSNGTVIPNANAFLTPPFAGMTLFETPQVLPESLNFTRSMDIP